MRYSDNPEVHQFMVLLLLDGFDHPYRVFHEPPMTYGETLLRVADRFGDQAAIDTLIRMH